MVRRIRKVVLGAGAALAALTGLALVPAEAITGGQATPITSYPSTALAVLSASRDGNRTILAEESDNVVFDLTAGAVVPVPLGRPEQLSSDGTLVLVETPTSQTWIVDLTDGSRTRRVHDGVVAMSPDGSAVVWPMRDALTDKVSAWLQVGSAPPVELTAGLDIAAYPAFGGARFSGDGRYVLLDVRLGGYNCFLFNACAYPLVRATVPAAGSPVDVTEVALTPTGSRSTAFARNGRISANGRYVTFVSSATDLVPGIVGSHDRLFRRDLWTSRTIVPVDDTFQLDKSDEQLSRYEIDDAADRVVYRGSPLVDRGGIKLPSTRVHDVDDGSDALLDSRPTLRVLLTGDGRTAYPSGYGTGQLWPWQLPPTVSSTLWASTPQRLLDTRPDSSIGYAGVKPAAGQVVTVTVPAGNVAVALNVTAVDATAPGYVSVYPCGSPPPNASNLNLVPGIATPNAVVVGVGIADQVCIFTQSGAHLIVDLTATFPQTSAIVPVVPRRLVDTRLDSAIGYAGPKPAAGATVTVATGASAGDTIMVNVTGVEPTADGFVTAYPCGEPRPGTSNLNLRRGVTAPNLVAVKAGVGGAVCLYTDAGAHLIADLTAVVPASTRSVTPLSPTRLLDTRPDSQVGYSGPKPVAGAIVAVSVPGNARVAFVNVTGVDPTAAGYVTAYPCGTAPPNASTLNLAPSMISPNLAIVGVGAEHEVCLYSQSGAHLVADLTAVGA